MFKVIIVGGDGYNNYPLFEKCCIACLRKKAKEGCGILILTTGEECNDKFARRFGIDLKIFLTDWKKDGNDALKIRNEKMVEEADALICFKDGTHDTEYLYKKAVLSYVPSRLFDEHAEEKLNNQLHLS